MFSVNRERSKIYLCDSSGHMQRLKVTFVVYWVVLAWEIVLPSCHIILVFAT